MPAISSMSKNLNSACIEFNLFTTVLIDGFFCDSYEHHRLLRTSAQILTSNMTCPIIYLYGRYSSLRFRWASKCYYSEENISMNYRPICPTIAKPEGASARRFSGSIAWRMSSTNSIFSMRFEARMDFHYLHSNGHNPIRFCDQHMLPHTFPIFVKLQSGDPKTSVSEKTLHQFENSIRLSHESSAHFFSVE